MGITNKKYYTERQIEMANLCRALGHPARYAIVEHLMEGKAMYCKELNVLIPISQSNLSKHIKELFEAGILSCTVVKNKAFYHVREETISDIIYCLELIKNQMKPKISYSEPSFSRFRINLNPTRAQT